MWWFLHGAPYEWICDEVKDWAIERGFTNIDMPIRFTNDSCFFRARSSNGATLRFETGLLFFKSGQTVGPTANQKNKKEKKGPRKPAKTVSKTRRTNLRSPPQRRNARTMHQLKWTHPAKRTRFHRNCSSHGSPQWQNQVD